MARFVLRRTLLRYYRFTLVDSAGNTLLRSRRYVTKGEAIGAIAHVRRLAAESDVDARS